MSPRNRPKSHSVSGLIPNGGGAGGGPAGSAPKANTPGSWRASRPALRRFFAPGTAVSAEPGAGGFESSAADVDELVATLGRPRRVGDVGPATAAPAAGFETEASGRFGISAAISGPDVGPDVLPTAEASARVCRRGEVLAEAELARAFPPSPGGLAASG